MENDVLFDQETFLAIGAERSQKFHVLKFRSVMEKLVEYDASDFFKNNHSDLVPSLVSLKAMELLEFGTDFFWSSVHRLFNTFDAGNEMTEIMYGIFLQNAFDSFFSILPVGTWLKFKNYGDDKITFINLGISFEAFLDWQVFLEKTGVNQVAYGYLNDINSTGSQKVNIEIDNIPFYQRIKCETISDKIKVLFQRHQVLFESAYHYECNESVFLGQLFLPRLKNAFEIIRQVDDRIYNKIIEGLDYIVPLAKPGKQNHPSFASALLKRTIFLSLDLLETSDVYLAECIIHEFGHCQLYKVQDTVLLTQVDLNKRYYYSPWRTDPRHLLGLVHGIYVFSCVINFYHQSLRKSSISNEIREWVYNRMVLLIYQVNCAISQVRQDEIAQAGAILLNDINCQLQETATSLNIDLKNNHPELWEHQEAWKLKNSGPEFKIL